MFFIILVVLGLFVYFFCDYYYLENESLGLCYVVLLGKCREWIGFFFF